MAAKKSMRKKAAGTKKAAGRKSPATKKAAARKASTKKKVAAKKKAPAKKPAGGKTPAAETTTPAQDAAAPAATPALTPGAPPARAPRRKPLPPRREDGTITVGFSPDADDAFMFYALAEHKVETEDRRYELVRDEIQSLNERAREGIYDVTAISFAAYPHLADRYLLLTCGASFGDGQGPTLVARSPIKTNEVNGLRVAVPGLMTTATLALRLWLPHADLDLVEVPFDDVIPALRTGKARAGVLIHERQLTWREDNLVLVKDLGQWWAEHTEGLPLPLGANAIRRDIPEEDREKIALDVKRSIAYALGHREEALDYAMRYAKGLPRPLVDRYVEMYVNELALDYAERGRQAILQFFEEAKRFRFIPPDSAPAFA